jgi:hypothetical protein
MRQVHTWLAIESPVALADTGVAFEMLCSMSQLSIILPRFMILYKPMLLTKDNMMLKPSAIAYQSMAEGAGLIY